MPNWLATVSRKIASPSYQSSSEIEERMLTLAWLSHIFLDWKCHPPHIIMYTPHTRTWHVNITYQRIRELHVCIRSFCLIWLKIRVHDNLLHLRISIRHKTKFVGHCTCRSNQWCIILATQNKTTKSHIQMGNIIVSRWRGTVQQHKNACVLQLTPIAITMYIYNPANYKSLSLS